MSRSRLILPPEYKDLVIENWSLQKELALINGYAARLAQQLVDLGQRGGQGGRPDAPPIRAVARPVHKRGD